MIPDSLQSRLSTLFRRHGVEVKFLLIGGWNTIFAILCFSLLDTVFSYIFSLRYVAYMSAMVLTNLLSVMMAFVLHKYFTFRSRAKGVRLLMEFIRFLMTYALVFCVSLALLPVLAEGFNIPPKVSAAIGILMSIIISYITHSRFSFSKKDRVA
ncbi:MAG: GtrA-like protein [Syntrophorhabdus sp. PtaU1.Bin153]|nr:MAG: GtrA-like protein [Syntrophorhabdus sp. PtaU1.Bin153]